MLAKRIIPCLDVKDGKTVKGVCFGNLRDAGDPVELGRRYSEEGADELVFLDITASSQRRKTLVDMVSRVARSMPVPTKFPSTRRRWRVRSLSTRLQPVSAARCVSWPSTRAVSTAIGNVSLTEAAVLPDADCLNGLRRLNAVAQENCCLRVWTTTV